MAVVYHPNKIAIPLLLLVLWLASTAVAISHGQNSVVSTLTSSVNDPRDAYRRTFRGDINAKCIDGSQPIYFLRRGSGDGSQKWIIFFEGGGWCYTLDECYLRSMTDKGSATKDKGTLPRSEMTRYLSSDESENPHMFNWNMAFVRYCDGGSFAGNSIVRYKDTILYFKGQVNRDESIRALLREEGMSAAEEVVIAGASAGALAVYLGIDQMADIIHQHADTSTASATSGSMSNDRIVKGGTRRIRVRGLADSGFFMQYSSEHPMPSNDYTSAAYPEAVVAGRLDYAEAMRNVFTFMNVSAGANPACLSQAQLTQSRRRLRENGPAADDVDAFLSGANYGMVNDSINGSGLDLPPRYPNSLCQGVLKRGLHERDAEDSSECIFAAHLAPHIRTPVFALQPRYDPWQIDHIFGVDASAEEVNDYGIKLQHKLSETLLYPAAAVATAVAASSPTASDDGRNPGHAAFIDSCAHHTKWCLGDNPHSQVDAWAGSDIRSSAERMSPADAVARWLQHLRELEEEGNVKPRQESRVGFNRHLRGKEQQRQFGNDRNGQMVEDIRKETEDQTTKTEASTASDGRKMMEDTDTNIASATYTAASLGEYSYIQNEQFPCVDCCRCNYGIHHS